MIGRSGSEPSPAGGGGDVVADGTGTGLPWPKYLSPADLVIAAQRARISELEGMLRAALHMKAPTHEFRPPGELDLGWRIPVVDVLVEVRRPDGADILGARQAIAAEIFRGNRWTLAYAIDDATRTIERALFGVGYLRERDR